MSTLLHWQPAAVAGRRLAAGPFAISAEEDSGLIVSAKVETGFIHRGIEKQLTKVPYVLGGTYAEKVDFLAAPACALAYVSAIERLAGIEIPLSAQYVRVLLLELNRIYSHLFALAGIAANLEHEPALQFSLRNMEKFKDLFELYCGSRLGFGAIRLGGVAAEATEGLLFRAERALVDTKKFLHEIDILLTENPLVQHRLRGLAPMGLTKNNSYGVSGANLRAAGVGQDLRFAGDYLIYKELRIETPPIITFGDCAWGRYLQRIFEIEQSIDIIQAVIGSLPKGAAAIPVGLDFSAPKGEWLESIEGPRGVIYCWVQTDGGRNPARVKFATPSYSTLRLVPKILRSLRVDDLWLALASLDLSISEVDR